MSYTIKHSELTKMLLDVENTTPKMLNAYIGRVIAATKHGVHPEGFNPTPAITNESNSAAAVKRFSSQPSPYRETVEAFAANAQIGRNTGFKWGKKSLFELQGVKEELVRCSTLALERFTAIDFTCFDGLRTKEEQARYVKNGASRTMDSKHLKGLAVDLVPIMGGVPKWDWEGCYRVAYAMDQAATHLNIAHKIRWGGAWDRTLADFGGNQHAYAAEVEAYKTRHDGPDFIDGPHFEWVD